MKKSLLIGDSGGTGTDWCFVDTEGRRTYFTSDSYHPAQFSAEFLEKMQAFWKEKNFPLATEVHFYGAGCSMKHNQQLVENHFKSIGFECVEVESDLLGTCRGLLGNSSGVVGILGTGSVLAEYDGKSITKIHGGFGYLIGDEGSGYSFGKELIHRYLNGDLPEMLSSAIFDRIGDRSEVLQNVYGSGGKKWVSDLASAFERTAEIEDLHRQNISEFVELYLQKLNVLSKTICFSGSYAFHNQSILTSILSQNAWKLADCVARPIEKITDYTMDATLQ